MALTNSQPNNINVPNGNGLVVYIDGETNQVYVRDVRGATEELNVLTESITTIIAEGGLTALKVGSVVTMGTDSSIIQLKVEKGQPNGYASLDANGKLPVSQLPVSVLTYEGMWNAATNTPTLVDGVGGAGDFYIVSVAGTQNLGSGPIVFEVGDWVIYNGSIWQRNASNFPDLQEVTDVGATTTKAINTGGITTDYVQLDLTATPTLTVGMARWNTDQLTWEVGIGTGPIAYEMGQSLFYPQVRNTSGTNLPKGTLVMVDPTDVSTGDRLNVIRAVANGTYISQLFVGILAQAINSNATGFAIWFGQVYNVANSAINLGGEAWAEGDILYASAANPGGLTKVEPAAPNLKVTIAAIQAINGSNVNLIVRPWLNEDIGQLNDVSITSPVDNSILQFNSTTGVWEDVAGTTTNIAEGTNLYFTTARARESVSAGTGISYDNTTGVITNSDRGSSQDIFKNIAVATQSTVTADTNNDTLTLAAGTNIGITTDATTDTITFSTINVPTGTGIANYIALWSTSSNLSTSLLYDNGQNIGLNTATPFSLGANTNSLTIQGTNGAAIELQTNSVGGLRLASSGSGSLAGEVRNLNFDLYANAAAKLGVLATGTIRLYDYGTGTKTGTMAYNLAVDASGNVIETPGGVIDGSGTTNYVAKFTDANTIADSQIFDNGTNLGIGTTTPLGTANYRALTIAASTGGELYLGRDVGVSTLTAYGRLQANSTEFTITSQAAIPIRFGTNGVATMILTNDGKLGVNTLTPNLTSNSAYGINVYAPTGESKIKFTTGATGQGDYDGGEIYQLAANLYFVNRENGDLRFYTNDAEVMRMNSSHNMIVGGTADANYGPLTIGNTSNADTRLQLLSISTGVGGINFGDTTASTSQRTAGYVLYDHATNTLSMGSNAFEGFVMNVDRKIKFNAYGLGVNTGTPAYNLSVDTSGNIIETPGAVISGSGTTNYVSKFTGTQSIGDSQIFDNGTNVGIGTASPTQLLHVSGSARITGSLYDSTNDPGAATEFLSSTGSGTAWATAVTSVAFTVPTGFAIANSPITTSGTLGLTFAAGYSLPTDSRQTEWDTSYNNSITAFAYNTGTGVLTLTQQDLGTLTATVTLQPFTTTNLAEGTNLYYTDARVRLALSAGTGISYDNTTGVITNSDRGSSQFIFKNVAVTGSDLIVADSNDDTITFTAGSGVTLSSNAGTDTITISATGSGGTVTSISLTAPTGFTVSGSPLTTSGTLSIGFDTGYSLPTTAKQTTWDDAYDNKITASSFSSATGTLTLTQQDTGTLTTNFDGRYILLSEKAAANGVATLDGSGKIPSSQLPSSVFEYKGLWNAATNTPTLADGTGDPGDVYQCNVAGTVNFGSGPVTFAVGDLVIYDGTEWQKSDSTTEVESVNGQTGVVVLTTTNINEGTNLYYTDARARLAISGGTGITYNNTAGTITNADPGSSQAIFKNIEVAGQSTVVAELNNDTLTLVAGTNISITTNATTDTITINSTDQFAGTVTSVDMSVPTGFTISGNPITSAGTLGLAFASGYSLPTDSVQGNWTTAYNRSLTAFAYNTTTGVLTLTEQDASTLTATITLQPFTTTNLAEGTNLYFTDARARAAISLTTTGTSGAAAYNSTTGVLNIPQYQAALTNPVTGTGTTNYVAKWSSSSAITDSLIFDNGTNVGISNATPGEKLDITGNARVSSYYLFSGNPGNPGVSTASIYDQAAVGPTISGLNVAFRTGSTPAETMRITDGGKVGIGNSSPNEKLEISVGNAVTGGLRINYAAAATGEGMDITYLNSGNTTTSFDSRYNSDNSVMQFRTKTAGTAVTAMTILGSGNVGIGSTGPGYKLTLAAASATDADIFLAGMTGVSNGFTVRRITSSFVYSMIDGSLGVGTSTPDAILHVAKAVSSGVGGQIVIDNPSSSAVGNTAELSFLTDAGASGAGTRNAKILAVNTNAGNGAAELQFYTWNGAAELKRLNIASNGVITMPAYGSGGVTGTPTFNLAVDSSGNIIETPGGVVDGSGTANYVTKWQDANTVTNSSITDDGTTVTALVNRVAMNQQAGIYVFPKSVGASASAGVFEIKNQHGAQALRVAFVCSTSGYSVAKTYEVVHCFAQTPIYSKVVDTGPFSGEDFNVVFTNNGDNTGLIATITNNSTSLTANIVATVFLGGSSTTITITAL